jgi:hypothetical protein
MVNDRDVDYALLVTMFVITMVVATVAVGVALWEGLKMMGVL